MKYYKWVFDMSFQDIKIDSIETSLTKKPSSPQITIKNPLKKTIFVNSIQLSFDAYFSERGAVFVKINNNPILNKKAGSLKNIKNLSVPLKNQEFFQQQKIEIFIWNGIDTNTISMGYDIKISEDPNSSVLSNVPLSQIQRNSEISDFVELFTQKNYFDETVTQLVDMKGYKKMILLIGGSNIVSPTILIGTSPIADGDLNTSMNYNPTQTKTVRASVDFGSIASRVPASKVGFTPAIDDCNTFFLEVSNDNVNWSQVATWQRCTSPSTTIMIGAEQSFRYMRVQDQGTPQGSWQTGNLASIYELYDANTIGGTASISFEVLLDSTWIELISAIDLGTITQGLSLTKTIGDVINDLATNKFNIALPSTQTNFRIKMIVTDHLNIGVSMMRV